MPAFVRSVVRVVAMMSLAGLTAGQAAAEQVVTVGAAYFPPYVVKREQSLHPGLLPQLLDALNQLQDDYRFINRPTAIARRFADFKEGRNDMALFENPAWGWQGIDHHVVDMGLEDFEVFVSRSDTGRGQGYFAELQGKRLALYNGYHYAFAGFNSTPDFLRKNFNATLTYSHDSNLLMVLHDRVDIAAVTRSFIDDFLQRHRKYVGQLLISQRIDQSYRHKALIRPGAAISPAEFTDMLERLRANGQLAKIFEPFHIAVIANVADSSITADATD
jgi:ABC-type amino acid transport substrate-binding protein